MGSVDSSWKDRLFLLCLTGLLILRFPVVILASYRLLPVSRDVGMTVFEVGTYLLTALMILIKRDRLEQYHIDRFTLALLIFAPIGCFAARGILQKGWGELPAVTCINGAQALLLGLALLIWRPALPKRGAGVAGKWVGFAALVGITFSAVTGWLIHFQRVISPEAEIYLPRQAARAVLLFFVQLSAAAALEEPLFRGFLWGELRERGWKEGYIWLFQALLFTLGHIYYLGTANLSLFVIVPLGALVLGLAAWSSRSVGISMLIHGIGNSLGGNFFALLWR